MSEELTLEFARNKPEGLCFPASSPGKRADSSVRTQMLPRRTWSCSALIGCAHWQLRTWLQEDKPGPLFTLPKGAIHKLHKSSSQLSVDEKWAGPRRREYSSKRRWAVTDDVFSLLAPAAQDNGWWPAAPEYESTLAALEVLMTWDWYLAGYYVASLSVSSSSHWRPSAAKSNEKKKRKREKKTTFDYTLFLHGEALASGFTGKHWIRQLTATLRCTARTSAQTW